MSSGIVWSRGSLNKRGIWSFYVAANIFGSFLCGLLVDSIRRMGSLRTSLDWPVLGLHVACAIMSLTCAGQCLVSMVEGIFYGGDWACRLEAVFHVTAIIAQFGCLALMAIRNYLAIVHRERWPESKLDVWTYRATIAVFAFAYTSVTVFTPFSEIYLVSAGAYCFFRFNSIVILMLVSFLIGAVIVMVFCYAGIFKEWRRTRMLRVTNAIPAPSAPPPSASTVAFVSIQRPQTAPVQITVSIAVDLPFSNPRPSEIDVWKMTIRIVIISVLNVGALLIGWGFALVATVHELGQFGEATEVETVGVGVGGVLNSTFQPLLQFAFRDVHRSYMADRLASIGVTCGCQPSSSDVTPNRSRALAGMVSTSGGALPVASRRNGFSSARTPAIISPPPSNHADGNGGSRGSSEVKSPSVSPAAAIPGGFNFRPNIEPIIKPKAMLTVPSPARKSRRSTAPAAAVFVRDAFKQEATDMPAATARAHSSHPPTSCYRSTSPSPPLVIPV